MRYNNTATALTKPIRQGREATLMSVRKVLLELLIGVLSSMLATLILQMLGR